MSKLSDYSKFDHLDSDSEEEPETATSQKQPQSQQALRPQLHTATPNAANTVLLRHPDTTHCPNRFVLQHGGHAVYEWEQTLGDLTLFVPTPLLEGGASQMQCQIQPNRLTIGVRGSQRPFLDEATFGTVDVDHSTWTWEEVTTNVTNKNDDKNTPAAGGLLTVELSKANKGVVWEAVCCGTEARLNPLHLEEERSRLMRERWGEQYGGMDFRDAKFNGAVPDPRSFMGGVSYD